MEILSKYHVVLGNPEQLFKLEEVATKRLRLEWAIDKTALAGDVVFFYLTRPVSSIVAAGWVLTNAAIKKGKGHSDSGPHVALIGGIILSAPPTPIGDLKESVPDWNWLKQPRREAAVPGRCLDRFLSVVGLNRDLGLELAEPETLEGMQREAARLTRTRSKVLRDEALEHSKGVCEACGKNFRKYLDGLGTAALQVHHRRQLSLLSRPKITKQTELAVLCANCHSLIHANPRQSLRVEELKRLMASTGRKRKV